MVRDMSGAPSAESSSYFGSVLQKPPPLTSFDAFKKTNRSVPTPFAPLDWTVQGQVRARTLTLSLSRQDLQGVNNAWRSVDSLAGGDHRNLDLDRTQGIPLVSHSPPQTRQAPQLTLVPLAGESQATRSASTEGSVPSQ